MAESRTKLRSAVEAYLADLRRIRASGGGTGERSYYPSLTNLLNAVGGTLKPKVFCITEMAEQGAGHPDLGLYDARQVQRRRPREGQVPERGVAEIKPASDNAWLTASSDQVSRYWNKYRLVLVTNTRDFVLLGEDAAGNPVKLETFRLAQSAEEFESLLERPHAFAREVGAGLGEYLCRALSHRAALVEPMDLAWLLASYARDGLARVETAGRRTLAPGGALGAGGGPRRTLRRRAGRGVLPLDSRADAVLRRLLRLGALGAADTASYRLLQLAGSRLASPRTRSAGAFSTALRPREVASPRPRPAAGLDGGRPGPSGSRRLLRPLRPR